jgi:hypothetical protein
LPKLYFILFHLHLCSLHITELNFFYFIFQLIFHLLVQNRINLPVKQPIRKNWTRKNRTFKKDWIGPHYCNCILKRMVFLGSNPLYPTHCPPLPVLVSKNHVSVTWFFFSFKHHLHEPIVNLIISFLFWQKTNCLIKSI